MTADLCHNGIKVEGKTNLKQDPALQTCIYSVHDTFKVILFSEECSRAFTTKLESVSFPYQVIPIFEYCLTSRNNLTILRHKERATEQRF